MFDVFPRVLDTRRRGCYKSNMKAVEHVHDPSIEHVGATIIVITKTERNSSCPSLLAQLNRSSRSTLQAR